MSAFKSLYVGTMNDGLFIIDQPPRPAPKDEDTGTLHKVNVIATMANNDREASALANVMAAGPHLYRALQAIVEDAWHYRTGCVGDTLQDSQLIANAQDALFRAEGK